MTVPEAHLAGVMRVGLGLGSNLGDRLANLRRAREQILAIPGQSSDAISAPLFETDPVDCADNAGAFLNTVIEIGLPTDTNLPRLLARLREIEQSLGRPSRHPRHAPRPIDLDILYAGSRRVAGSDLTLPHPRLHQRRFVLAPLAAIRPDLVLPDRQQSIAEILRELKDAGNVRFIQISW